MTELIRMEGIDEGFPGVQALKDARLDLRAGEVHALMGENGAGKSTLMKILSGIGYETVKAAVAAARGETVPAAIDTGFMWYDKSNIDSPEIAAVLYD